MKNFTEKRERSVVVVFWKFFCKANEVQAKQQQQK